MDVRQAVSKAVITGSVAAVATLTIAGLVRVFTAEARAVAAPRVARENGQYLVAVRGPGEWHDIRDFIRPQDPQVQAVVQEVGTDLWELYRYVCENIDYRRELMEFWRWPDETLMGYGDCEDSSILLTSLLRAPGYNAVTAVGQYAGYGHAWTELDSQILETTLTAPALVEDVENYSAHFYFNEQVAVEVWPGALEEVFRVRRNEFAKIKLMAGA